MTSIIAMKPVRAWFLFALGISFPVLMLELAAEETSRSWAEQMREGMVTERARAAVEVREAFEAAQRAGEKTLEAVPPYATADEALSVINAAPNPFAMGFAFTVQDHIIMMPAVELPPDVELKSLNENETLRSFARGGGTLFVDQGPLSFDTNHGEFVTARRLPNGLVVGWLVDDAMVLKGAQPHLAHDLVVEPAPIEGLAYVEGTVVVGVHFSANDVHDPEGKDGGAESKAKREELRRKINAVSSESLTHFSLAPKLHPFRISMKPEDMASFELIALRLKQSAFGIVSACLFALVVASASFFWRARKAQKLADLRTDFVAAVSHELRTPLASVRMFAELLEAGDVPEDERKEVEETLAGETRRLNATLDRMLPFGALARGKLVIEKRLQAIRPILEDAAKHRNVTIECDPSLEGNVDGGMLGNAVDNLLSNAVKYAPDGQPYVVRARAEKKNIVIDVIDHGPGLSRKAQRKIFLPFERADARLSKATEGSGVGLALVRGIAQAHGGDATVKSKLGQGATFTLHVRRV